MQLEEGCGKRFGLFSPTKTSFYRLVGNVVVNRTTRPSARSAFSFQFSNFSPQFTSFPLLDWLFVPFNTNSLRLLASTNIWVKSVMWKEQNSVWLNPFGLFYILRVQMRDLTEQRKSKGPNKFWGCKFLSWKWIIHIKNTKSFLFFKLLSTVFVQMSKPFQPPALKTTNTFMYLTNSSN